MLRNFHSSDTTSPWPCELSQRNSSKAQLFHSGYPVPGNTFPSRSCPRLLLSDPWTAGGELVPPVQLPSGPYSQGHAADWWHSDIQNSGFLVDSNVRQGSTSGWRCFTSLTDQSSLPDNFVSWISGRLCEFVSPWKIEPEGTSPCYIKPPAPGLAHKGSPLYIPFLPLPKTPSQ